MGVLRGLTVFCLAFAVTPALNAGALADLEAQLRSHPALQALQFEVEANERLAEAAMGLPDPVLSLGVNNVSISDPVFDRFLSTNKAIGISQQIPNRTTRVARAAGASERAIATERLADLRWQSLRADLYSTLRDLGRVEAQQSLAVQRERKLDELTDVIAAEIEAGRPIVFRLAQMDVEKAEVARERVWFASERGTLQARLRDLVGDVPASLPRVPQPELIDWDGNPESFQAVQLSRAGVAVAAAAVDEARSGLRPNFGLSLTYQLREDGRGGPGSTFVGDDWFSAMLTVSLPVWASSSQEPRLRAAQQRRLASEQERNAAARRAEADWRSMREARLGADGSATMLQQKIAALDLQLAALLRNYESGIGDYSPYLDAEIARFRLQAQVIGDELRRDVATFRANSMLVVP